MIYYVENEKCLNIVEKYKINEIVLFQDENEDLKNQFENGLNILYNQVINDLERIRCLDLTGICLLNEAYRFLIFAYNLQKSLYINELLKNYYQNILNFFHQKDLLRFKNKIIQFKQYDKKKTLINIKVLGHLLPYKSFYNLQIDYGVRLAKQMLSWD